MYKFVMKNETKKQYDIKKQIKDLEKAFSIRFPDELSAFYKECEGEKVHLCALDIDGYKCEVAEFVPLTGKGLTFEKIVQNDRTDGFLSASLYPIARDRGGNYYYWDSNTEEVFLLLNDDYDNPFKVANNISDFFSKLDGCIKN